ncbi:hypothetical protein PMIN07_002678 [Paraphaeosphaeria minitans]
MKGKANCTGGCDDGDEDDLYYGPDKEEDDEFYEEDGSSLYWEDQGCNFGEEPAADDHADRAWDCTHEFSPVQTIAEQPSANTAPAATHMDCMECWATIHPVIKMPHPPTTDESTTTTPAAHRPGLIRIALRRAYRTRLAQRQAASVRSLRGEEDPLGSSPASFSSVPSSGVSRGRDAAGARGLGLDGGADDDMPVRDGLRDGRSGNLFEAEAAPFSFAYECDRCRIVVCHRCKDALEGARQVTHAVDTVAANVEDVTRRTRECDTQGIGGEEEICGREDVERGDGHVGCVSGVGAWGVEVEAGYEGVWKEGVAE